MLRCLLLIALLEVPVYARTVLRYSLEPRAAGIHVVLEHIIWVRSTIDVPSAASLVPVHPCFGRPADPWSGLVE